MSAILFVAQLFGLLGVVFYFLSFQQRHRRGILFINIVSRIFYVLQYLLLGAFDGMAMDLLGLISALLAASTNALPPKKRRTVFLAINLVILAAGILFYRNLFSLLAIAAVILETTALWFKQEHYIRLLSLISAPLWLVYNLSALAFGSALGNVLAMLSLLIAMVRYRRSQPRS